MGRPAGKANQSDNPARGGAIARLFGLGLAGMGAAHLAAPDAFDPVTEIAFPHDTRRWTYRNGGTELLVGLALAARRTRVLGGVGLIAYVSFVATRYTSR